MTPSTGPTKKESLHKCCQQMVKAEVREKHCGFAINRYILPDQWSKDATLQVPELERSHAVAENGRSRSCSSVDVEEAQTTKQGLCAQSFSTNANKSIFLSDDGKCDSPGADTFQLHGETESKQNHASKSTTEDENIKSTKARLLTEEEKIRERSRKGRERSLRTRRRNIARLRLLEENCIHFSKENEVLRELVGRLGDHDTERVIELFKRYKLLREEKPEPHKLSRSESFYTDLLSPLSVTTSTGFAEADSKERKETEAILTTEHSLIPSTYKGKDNKEKFEAPTHVHRIQDGETSVAKTSVPDISDVCIARGINLSSIDAFYSVFADPAYCDDKNFGLTVEDIYGQPPLSAEEICHLLEQGSSLVETLRL